MSRAVRPSRRRKRNTCDGAASLLWGEGVTAERQRERWRDGTEQKGWKEERGMKGGERGERDEGWRKRDEGWRKRREG